MQPAEKMTMTLPKLLSDEEEGFIFSERHKVTQTKNNQLAKIYKSSFSQNLKGGDTIAASDHCRQGR